MFAFEITVDDVHTAVTNHYSDTDQFIEVSMEWCKEVFENLDYAVVEKAALRGDEMEEQTRYAYEAIIEELIASGDIKKVKTCPNCDQEKKDFQSCVDGTNLEDRYGCPECDDS